MISILNVELHQIGVFGLIKKLKNKLKINYTSLNKHTSLKSIIKTILFCLFTLSVSSQEQITLELEKAYKEEKFNWIISHHSKDIDNYPSKAIYYVGMAYYMNGNDKKVLELMDLSIKKNNHDPDAYYIKGMSSNYMGNFESAIGFFNKAIELNSENTNYYSGLGDSFYSLKKLDKALEAYLIATEKDEPNDRPFTMIPQIYAQLNKPDKALEAFYKSKESISKESGSYITALYNIGLYEFLNGEYDMSENAFTELIKLAPNDYHSISKLIQVYYGKKEYEKAQQLRDILYEAYSQGLLEGNLKEHFCFDQFKWNDKEIFAFERFEVNEGKLYYKHIFYITNNKSGETEFTIQTENSPISVEMDGPKYAIGMDRNGVHSTFGFIEEDFKYDNLKKIVMKILEEQAKPISSLTKNN